MQDNDISIASARLMARLLIGRLGAAELFENIGPHHAEETKPRLRDCVSGDPVRDGLRVWHANWTTLLPFLWVPGIVSPVISSSAVTLKMLQSFMRFASFMFCVSPSSHFFTACRETPTAAPSCSLLSLARSSRRRLILAPMLSPVVM